jgi:hypothetical protein
MPIATGLISIFGADSAVTLTGTGMLSAGNMAMQSMGINRDVQTVDLENGSGKRIARYYFQPGETCSIEFVPFDPTSPGTLATLAAKVKLPAAGSKVTLATSTVAAFDGDWNYSGKGSIRPNQKGYLVMTMELERMGEDGSNNAAYLTSPA